MIKSSVIVSVLYEELENIEWCNLKFKFEVRDRKLASGDLRVDDYIDNERISLKHPD